MLLDLEGLGLRPGQSYTSTQTVEIAPVLTGGGSFEVVLPQGVNVSAERIAGGYMVSLEAWATVCGPCSRCLEEACTEVHAVQEEFIPSVAGGWQGSDSETTPFVEDLVLDVDGLAREAVVLALPETMVCKEECLGLCPSCGKALNEGPCSCKALEE